MKKVIILENQHFLKKNYTYNFFRSILKSNTIFLKNNLFFFKFYNLINFFFFFNFFFKKTILLNNCKNLFFKSNPSIFLKKKTFSNICTNFYGQNYIHAHNNNIQINMQNLIYKNIFNDNLCNLNFLLMYNYNYNYSYLTLLILVLLS